MLTEFEVSVDDFPSDVDIHVDVSQGLHVGRVEGVVGAAVYFGHAVASVKFVFEEESHFRDGIMTRTEQRTHQVFSRVTSVLENGNLGASQHYRFS